MALDFAPYMRRARSPLDVQNDLMQRDAMYQQNRLGEMKMAEYERGVADDKAAGDAYAAGGTDADIRQRLIDRRLIKSAFALDKHTDERAKQKAATDKDRLELTTKKLEAYKGLWPQVRTQQDAAQLINAIRTDPDTQEVITRAFPDANAAMAGIPADPAQLADYVKRNALKMSEFIADETHRRGQDQTKASQAATLAEQTRAHKASEGIAGGNLRVAQDREKREGAAATGGAEGFSPAAIENAAARYNMDGTLPPMGMGKAAGAGRTAILNRAAELAMGTPGAAQRVSQLDAKAAGQALNQLAKTKTMNSAFERTAAANADIALGLSDKLDRTGVPFINTGIQAWRTGTGSPEATQFAAANETFVAEYAKIMSGGMGNGPVSDAARKKASDLLQTSMTKDQYKGNVKLLQREMGNRMKGFDEEEAALKSRLQGQPAAPHSSASAPGKVIKFDKDGNEI